MSPLRDLPDSMQMSIHAYVAQMMRPYRWRFYGVMLLQIISLVVGVAVWQTTLTNNDRHICRSQNEMRASIVDFIHKTVRPDSQLTHQQQDYLDRADEQFAQIKCP